MIQNLKVGAVLYPVMVEPSLGPLGETSDTEIKVRKLETYADYLTLFHEALHALAYVKGMRLSERDVRTLEHDLVSLLRENPEMTKVILGGPEGMAVKRTKRGNKK